MNFLPERELELIKEFKSGPDKNIQPILDIFFEYDIYEKPTKGNISRLVNETRAIALVQAGTQANQFASAIDRADNITNFTENRAGKSFFFF